MDEQAFRASPVGRLVPITGHEGTRAYRHFAFVPTRLPSSVQLTEKTYKMVTDAALEAGRLDAAALRLPNPEILVRPAVYQEAVSTSALEGTHAALVDVLGGGLIEDRLRTLEVREILNYVAAAHRAIELLKTKPICMSVLSELQAILVRGTPGGGATAGRLRPHQVYIGHRRGGIENSRFVPPPPGEELLEGVTAWERWVNTESDMPLFVKLALTHYQFETLHPFNDGNGRLGRLVIQLQLLDAEALKYPILNLSEWFEPRRDDYTRLLSEVSENGRFDEWVQFFATAVAEQSSAGMLRIEEMLLVRSEMLSALKAAGNRGVLVNEIVDDLVSYPVVTPSGLAKAHNATYASARAAIDRLVALGYLEELTGRNYGRMFGCLRLIEVLEGRL